MIKVKFVMCGILIDDEHREYICDVDGWGSVQSVETGELFEIAERDDNEYPTKLKHKEETK